jgi:hypothetical protein
VPAGRCWRSRHAGDQHRAAGHDGQRDDQPFAPSHFVDVGPRTTGRSGRIRKPAPKTAKVSISEANSLLAEEDLGDVGGIEAEQEEIELFEEIAAGHAQDRACA